MDETTIRPDPREEVPSPPIDGELTDEELEFVVGGLTRPWVEPRLPWDPDPITR